MIATTCSRTGCNYPEGDCLGVCALGQRCATAARLPAENARPPVLSAFAKAARRSYASSKAGTRAAERINIVQSAQLRHFTPAERTGSATQPPRQA